MKTSPLSTRRQALKAASAGFGYLALAGLLSQEKARATERQAGPLAPKVPHFPAKAKRIIFLFMQGAISPMDTWEYKPQLQKDDGKVGPGGGRSSAPGSGSPSTGRPAHGSRISTRTRQNTLTSCAISEACSPTPRPIPRR